MVAGMERYYQIARCYRDEDFRADRQPEFTQLDVEMSFVEQDDVIALTEEILVALWQLVGYDVPTPLPRITYAESMARYGTDKPDLRMGQELVECTEYFADTPFRVFQAPYVGAVVMPGRREPAAQAARRAGRSGPSSAAPAGLAYVLVGEDGELGGPVAKNLSEARSAPASPRTSGRRPGTASSSPRVTRGRAGRCSGAARARDRPPLRAHRRGRLELPLGRRRAAVRAGRGGDRRGRRRARLRRVDRRAPRVHQPEGPRAPSTPTPAAPWPGPTTSSATATRSAAGRSGSTARTCRSGSSR